MSIYQETTCTEDLLIQYQDTLKDTKNIIFSLEQEIESYKKVYENKEESEGARLHARQMAAPFLHDKTIYNSIKNELEFVITWMKTGHCPNNSRGIERRASYEKEKPFDPLMMQKFFRSTENTYDWDHEPKQQVIGPYDKKLLQEVLTVLTDREREAYLLLKGNAFTFQKVADMMSVSRGSVQAMMKRADKKIGRKMVQLQEGG